MIGETQVIPSRVKETTASARPVVAGAPSSMYGVARDFSSEAQVDSLIGADIARTFENTTTVGLIFSGQMDHSGGAGAFYTAQAYFVVDDVTYWGGPVAGQKYDPGGGDSFMMNMVGTISLPAGAHTFNVWLQSDRTAWTYHYLNLIVVQGGWTGTTSLLTGSAALIAEA